MRRILINLALMILAFTVQNCVFPLMPFFSASPNLLLIITFSIGFIEGSGAGMFYGLVTGILLDLFYSGPFGFYSLIYIWIGYMNGKCTRYYYEDYVTLPLFLCVLSELAYNLYIYVFRFLIRGRLDFFYYFREIILPEIIFTTVVTLLVYRLLLLITRWLEELEKRRGTKIV